VVPATSIHDLQSALNVAMDASKISKALLKHHVQRLGADFDQTNTSIVNLKSTAKLEPSSDITGELMANRFAHAASMALAPQECTQLQAFLEDCPRAVSPRSQEQFHNEIDNKIREFFATEIAVSSWDEDRLCTPSGKEDAELLIVLHCQTKDIAHPVGPFWDPTTFSIQNLAVKGYSTHFLYGFDWHWRAEEICVGRGRCSAAKMASKLEMSTRRLLFFTLEFAAFSLCLGWWRMRQNTCAEIHRFFDSSTKTKLLRVGKLSSRIEPGVRFDFSG